MALSVESTIEFFISNYFVKPQNSKTHFFDDVVVLKMSFEAKTQIFSKICTREGYNKNDLRKIIAAIKFVQEVRNKVAHWQTESMAAGTFQLRKRASCTDDNDILRLDDAFMLRVHNEQLNAVNGINKFYLEFTKNGTIDERELRT